jgi:5-methyltetrahydrofolate--homocysteine methyltransferase
MTELDERLAEVRPFWEAYWRGDTPMLVAELPREGVPAAPKPPWGAIQAMTVEQLADSLLAWADATEFIGGAVPGYVVSMHTGFMPDLLGAEVETCGDSHRPIPFIADLDTAEFSLQTDGPTWRRFVETAAALKERCGHKVLISAPTIGGNLDTLDGIRGTTNLLLDLIDNPPGVHRCLELIDTAHDRATQLCHEIFEVDRLGTINRHGMYCRGRVSVPQCDFSFMIGPQMFRDFGIPYLQREMQRLDGVEYHLDGPDSIRHLEAICELREVDLIQWVPGAGNERRDWSDLFRRIDEFGKGQLRGGPLHAFDQATRTYASSHLYWRAGGSPREEIRACARDLMAPYCD